MPNSLEARIIKKLREHVARDDLSAIQIIYRTADGVLGEPWTKEELNLFHGNQAKMRIPQTGEAIQEVSSQVNILELKELLQGLSKSVSELIPRSEARFLPDSSVGSITIQIDADEATFFFLIDKDQQQQQNMKSSINVSETIRKLGRFSEQLRKQKGVKP